VRIQFTVARLVRSLAKNLAASPSNANIHGQACRKTRPIRPWVPGDRVDRTTEGFASYFPVPRKEPPSDLQGSVRHKLPVCTVGRAGVASKVVLG